MQPFLRVKNEEYYVQNNKPNSVLGKMNILSY